ncbi:hypothetical protein [Mesorhizobium sp. M1409]|uniref:hypothetical protein n=1 Tax=unclassified Mesorhizobium TaxID=325217 RepID=UPI00333ABA7F
MIHLPNRRQVLALAATALLPPVAARAAAIRVAAIDWGMLETLPALGIEPVAATELIQFRKIAVEPAIPQPVIDRTARRAQLRAAAHRRTGSHRHLQFLRIPAPDARAHRAGVCADDL